MRAAQGIVIAAMLASGWGPAAAAVTSCPPAVMDKGAVKTADGGVDPPWARHYFRLAALYDGDPKHGAALTPSEELQDDRLIQTWMLGAAQAGRSTIVCRYSGTSQTVQQSVPAGVKRCTLVTMKDGDPPPELRCE